MSQIDLFKKLFVFDSTVYKKPFQKQQLKKCKYEYKMNAIS